jgi:hypothetical protein
VTGGWSKLPNEELLARYCKGENMGYADENNMTGQRIGVRRDKEKDRL